MSVVNFRLPRERGLRAREGDEEEVPTSSPRNATRRFFTPGDYSEVLNRYELLRECMENSEIALPTRFYMSF